ncbi:MAG: hypothetical protein PHF05_02380 [Candidatus Izemoplasmatales bacterium]|nr:hypothetical protein [Candidatus Izemoplasmatales bacterium]
MENKECTSDDLIGTCLKCGVVIVSIRGKKKKRFCSDRCRWDWWNSHIKQMKQESKATKNNVSK